MKRIRVAASEMHEELAENNAWVPIGGKWVEPEQQPQTVVRFN